MVKPFFLTAASSLLVLAGCVVGPDYQRPDVSAELPPNFEAPAGWKIAEPGGKSPIGAWWKVFREPRLDALIGRAMDESLTLEASFLRVEQARALTRAGRAAFFPQIDFEPSFERTRSSGSRQTNTGQSSGSTFSTITVPLVLDYEIDLWGKLRRGLEAANADAEAAEENFRSVALTLQSEIAVNYFNLAATDNDLVILAEALALREKSLSLNDQRFKAGDIDEVDVTRAKTEVSNTESEIFNARRERAVIENALAALTGQPSSGFSIPSLKVTGAPPDVPGALPSELLERRPDVASAERTMQAANARIGVAKAAFFPTVSLTGDIGYESAELSNLFTSNSLAWGLGPGVSFPVIDGGRNKIAYDRSILLYGETVANYRQTILDAVRDVDNALVAIDLLAKQNEALQRSVAAAGRTVELSQKRYDAGIVAFFDVVDAQRTSLDAQQAASEISNARYLAAVSLIKALGGNWR